MGEMRDRALWWELPDVSLTPGLLDHLESALDQVSADLSIRALVITGRQEKFDSIFSVGMNIDFLGECFADPPESSSLSSPATTRYSTAWKNFPCRSLPP